MLRPQQLVTIILLHKLCDVEPKHLYKRSPLDTAPIFANYYPQLSHLTANHIVINEKQSDVLLVHHNYPQATSNVHHSSLHTDIKHVLKDNVKYPVLTQTLTHSSTNITHPSQPRQYYLSFLPQKHVFLHDLSVIPLRKAEKINRESSYEEYSARFRNFYGGFGEGLSFGGHGAGHGFFAYYG